MIHYADPQNHNFRALRDYSAPIAKLMIPASFGYGLLALVSGPALRKIFEKGVMEHIAIMSIPLAFASLIFFAGLTVALSKCWLSAHSINRSCANYFAVLTVSLNAVVFGVAAGILIPFILMNGIVAGLSLLVQAVIFTGALAYVAHGIGFLLYSSWPAWSTKYRVLFGLGTSLVGLALFVNFVLKYWCE